jgi:hypothetical protein
VNSLVITPRPSPIERWPPTNGRSAALPNRLHAGCRSGVLTRRRCASRSKPSIPILYLLPRGAFKRELVRYLRADGTAFVVRARYDTALGPIQDLISIDERPVEVADRTVPGHWKRDFLMGHANASAVRTLVERTTRFTLLVPLKANDAAIVREAFARELRTLPAQLYHSLTYDQEPATVSTAS